MNAPQYFLASGVVFAVIAVIHLLRLVNGWSFIFGDIAMPMSGSVFALIFAGALAVWAFELRFA